MAIFNGGFETTLKQILPYFKLGHATGDLTQFVWCRLSTEQLVSNEEGAYDR